MLRMRMKRPFVEQRFGAMLALLLLGGLAGGCSNSNMMLHQATPQPSVKQKYPIMVEPHQETMQLSPVLAGKSLTNSDARIITDFAGAFLHNGHGPLAIILPNIPDTPQMRGQVQAINEILAARGVPASRIEWRIATPGAAAMPAPAANTAGSGGNASPLIFSFTRYIASVERECGDWEKDFTSNRDNHTWSNFGCSAQHNLAAMVSDPLDLKQPRPTTPVDVDRRKVVIKSYREGQATATERTVAEKGTVSEVAK